MEKQMEHTLTLYITADCLISSLGFTTAENVAALREYRSGIKLQTNRSLSDTPLQAAVIDTERLAKKVREAGLENNGYTRMEQLFILAIGNLLEQTNISLKDETCGLILSTTKGNINLLDATMNEASDEPHISDSRLFLGEMAARIGNHFHPGKRVEVVSNACISGVSALIVAQRAIESRRYKQVIVAGGDVISHFITSGFCSFKSVSERPCIPYDARRDGLNLGEACGAVLLSTEGKKGDIILSGGGISNDANHISGPSRTGDGLFFAIRQAMTEAGIQAEEVSFVNAHGTATVYNDEMEAKALHLSGLENVPLNSLKPYFGHTLGASGIIETIICLHELKEGLLFGTLGYSEPGVSMSVAVSATHQQRQMNCCIKTASGFGGCNAAIVLALQNQALHKKGTIWEKGVTACHITATVSIENGRLYLNKKAVLTAGTNNFATFIREAYKQAGESNMKFYKMDNLCKLGYIASCYLLKEKSLLPEQTGLLLANAAASLDTDFRHQRLIHNEGDAAASPAVFVYTLPNVVAGEICIRHKIQGESTFFIEQEYDAARMEQYARIVMQKGDLQACIIGWCELLGNAYKAEFKLIESTV